MNKTFKNVGIVMFINVCDHCNTKKMCSKFVEKDKL